MLSIRDELVDAVARAKLGDRTAMEQVVERSTPMVRSMLRAHAGPHKDELDLLQEVLWEVWKTLPRLRDPRKYRAWLARIVTGKALDSLRRRYREDELLSFEDGVTMDDYPTPDMKDAFLDLLYKDLLLKIEAAIQQLPERYRNVLVLRLVNGLGIQEIADQTGRRPGTVKSLVSRGMRRLRENMERGA